MYQIKNVKYAPSRDGLSMTCTLHKGTDLVCEVEDEGEGGAVLYRFKHPDDERDFDAFAAEWGETTGARARNEIAMAPYRNEGAVLDKETLQETARSLWLIDAEEKFAAEEDARQSVNPASDASPSP